MVLSSFLLLLSVADQPQPADLQSRTEIIVEKQDGTKAVPMSPQHVYVSGDLIRIRFRTDSDGFLYVVNRDTRHRLTVLFPKDETGRENQIHAGTEYIIPATRDGWFRVEGEPGYDTAYFVLSPVDLRIPAKRIAAEPRAAPPTSTAESSLVPRCDDTLFKARGECLDSDSGVQSLSPGQDQPSGLSPQRKLVARDLTFIRKPESTVILSKPSNDSVMIYQIRIAHQ